MEENDIAGNREGGIKAAQTVKEKYGEDAFRKWGGIGNASRKNPYHGFTDKTLAAEAGAKGGTSGHRSRKITKDSPLRDDEWGVLGRVIIDVLNNMLEQGMDKSDYNSYGFATLAAWEVNKWYNLLAMFNDNDRSIMGNIKNSLAEEYDEYMQKEDSTIRHSLSWERLRVLRNLKTAIDLV